MVLPARGTHKRLGRCSKVDHQATSVTVTRENGAKEAVADPEHIVISDSFLQLPRVVQVVLTPPRCEQAS